MFSSTFSDHLGYGACYFLLLGFYILMLLLSMLLGEYLCVNIYFLFFIYQQAWPFEPGRCPFQLKPTQHFLFTPLRKCQ
jgi:hypothetical protein